MKCNWICTWRYSLLNLCNDQLPITIRSWKAADLPRWRLRCSLVVEAHIWSIPLAPPKGFFGWWRPLCNGASPPCLNPTLMISNHPMDDDFINVSDDKVMEQVLCLLMLKTLSKKANNLFRRHVTNRMRFVSIWNIKGRSFEKIEVALLNKKVLPFWNYFHQQMRLKSNEILYLCILYSIVLLYIKTLLFKSLGEITFRVQKVTYSNNTLWKNIPPIFERSSRSSIECFRFCHILLQNNCKSFK